VKAWGVLCEVGVGECQVFFGDECLALPSWHFRSLCVGTVLCFDMLQPFKSH